MKTELRPCDIYLRARWAILRDFDCGFFAAIRCCDPSLWPDCDARTVAEHVQAAGVDDPIYQTWHAFPGGFPRFLDMRNDARQAAEHEQGLSTIDWFSVAMADEVLRRTCAE